MVCEICGDKGKIVVSCLILEDGTIKPLTTFPCPRCSIKGDKNDE